MIRKGKKVHETTFLHCIQRKSSKTKKQKRIYRVHGPTAAEAVFAENLPSIKENLCGTHDSLSFISHLDISALSHKVE